MNSKTGSGDRQKPAVVDGFLLLNKPAGMTSNHALQKIKRLLKAKKAGHTGSLDPAATGMLPLCFGEATKMCAFLLEADKSYRVTARLGIATDTGDADGEVTDTADVPEIDHGDWSRLLGTFTGDIEQVPPMYSALKQNGKRLYELARKGEVVEREARPINIREITLLECSGTRLVFRVHCSKGTYVRTLVEDIAGAAETVAHTANLHRETVGEFSADRMLDMSGAEAAARSGPEGLRKRLLPTDAALSGWASHTLGVTDEDRFCVGQAVDCDGTGPGLVRIYGASGNFLGIGELNGAGRVAPKRIFKLTA